MSRSRIRLVAPIAAVLALASGPALADVTKNQCVDANSQGQELRREGKLSVAREQLRICSSPSCPAMVRDDCTKRLDELERAQPTIAFEVKDASGGDVSAVTVTMDGAPLAQKLDGTALPIDIGEHVFTFEVAGQPPVRRTLLLTEGEKGRREHIAMTGAAAPAPVPQGAPAPAPETRAPAAAAPVSAATEPPSTGGSLGAQKVLGLVAGGVGVAAVGVGSVFGLLTLSEKSQQQSACANQASCTSSDHAKALSDHSTGMTDGTISTVAFVAAGALLVGGALLFFTAGHAPAAPAAGMLVVPGVGPGGGGMFLTGEF